MRGVSGGGFCSGDLAGSGLNVHPVLKFEAEIGKFDRGHELTQTSNHCHDSGVLIRGRGLE